jgi:hypothetical protein
MRNLLLLLDAQNVSILCQLREKFRGGQLCR